MFVKVYSVTVFDRFYPIFDRCRYIYNGPKAMQCSLFVLCYVQQ